MTNNQELKPCPFCNGQAKDFGGYQGITFIKCLNCGAIVSFEGNESYTEATGAWNRRAENG